MYFNCYRVVNMFNQPPSSSSRRTETRAAAPAVTPVEALRIKHRKETLVALRDHGPLSRVELGRHIGLSATTLTKVMADLIGLGWVVEAESQRPREVGRPQIALGLVADACEVLAVAIEADALTLAIVGLDLEPRAVERHAFAAVDPEATITELAALIARHRAAHGGGARAVSVAVPGTTDSGLRNVLWAKPLGWQGVPLAERLEALCKLPVAVHNNTRAMGLAEFRHLGLHEDQPLLFVQTRFGLGASMVASAAPAKNGHYGASELAALPLGKNGFRAVSTDTRLLSVVGERYLQAVLGAGPADGPVVPLLEQRRDAGDATARKLYAQTVDNLARGLAVAVDILQPCVVVLGGIYTPASPRCVADLLAKLREHAEPELTLDLRLQCSELGVAGALQGAAMVAYDGLLADASAYRSRTDWQP